MYLNYFKNIKLKTQTVQKKLIQTLFLKYIYSQVLKKYFLILNTKTKRNFQFDRYNILFIFKYR